MRSGDLLGGLASAGPRLTWELGVRRWISAYSAWAETELLFRGNQSIRRKQKWKSRLGKTCHFPDLSGAGWGRRLGRLKRGPYSHLSAFPRTPRRENDPPHLPFPTHPGSPFSPFLHLLFPSSEKSLVPERPESVPSPLPLPRGSPHPQPSLLPPPRFHSIDFCCRSTFITGEWEGIFFSFSRSLNDF